ncbi:MAG: hypothetical protein CL484_14730, partial [Acidobacteria bacterium]|nr:hypothetical protein [Acidobacteriota bacterium]
GSGKYGALGATVAAALLDREARSASLDADPAHGRLREPLLKVLHVLRALEATPRYGQPLELASLHTKIGQMAMYSPTVFNFYLPEFSPAGPLRAGGLTSPEAELATGPFLIGFFNGMNSLLTYGLSSCTWGFGGSVAYQTATGTRGTCWQDDSSDTTFGWVPVAGADDSAGLVDELDLLLTGGRLSARNRDEIVRAHRDTRAEGDAKALRAAQFLVTAASEFHATNANAPAAAPRAPAASIETQGRAYKAIVVLFLSGGADTWNLVVPHSDCASESVNGVDVNLRESYDAARGQAATAAESVHQIDVPAGTQPCGKFGVHEKLPIVASLYNAGDAAFVANVGTLVEPLTKQEFIKKTKRRPPSLFAHNTQVATTQDVHAGGGKTKGVLGRVVEALVSQPEPDRTAPYSLRGNVKILDGSWQPDILNKNGIVRFARYSQYGGSMTNMSRAASASAYAETYSALLDTALTRSETLSEILLKPEYASTTEWPDKAELAEGDILTEQFEQVARVIKARNDEGLQTERDVFFVNLDGFDTHSNMHETLAAKFDIINTAISHFHAEMVDNGTWDNVAILSQSDFGRTLRSNGAGTDHAWASHHFLVGGSVQGRQIHGSYPTRLDDDSPLCIRTGGRFLPTTPWEGVWYGLAEWFGVVPEKMGEVLPNLANFEGSGSLLSKEAMFNN